MNEIRPALTADVSFASVPADVMVKQVFKIAEILASVEQPQNFQTEARENRTKNRAQCELQYRRD